MDNNTEHIELNLQIGRLVLEGFSLTRYQQQQLKETIEMHLTRLFTTHGIPRENTPAVNIKSPVIQATRSPSPIQLGEQIALSVYNGLSDNIGTGNNSLSNKGF
ncbi:MAG: hypothetical protein KIT80_06470 [Chitinophagaceae bacterium]|nr:hypothetical protein [Chitinophagaceae bacterium]MCW5926540.1 hypothetical protein [Chitinophagaceae bacterium]